MIYLLFTMAADLSSVGKYKLPFIPQFAKNSSIIMLKNNLYIT